MVLRPAFRFITEDTPEGVVGSVLTAVLAYLTDAHGKVPTISVEDGVFRKMAGRTVVGRLFPAHAACALHMRLIVPPDGTEPEVKLVTEEEADIVREWACSASQGFRHAYCEAIRCRESDRFTGTWERTVSMLLTSVWTLRAMVAETFGEEVGLSRASSLRVAKKLGISPGEAPIVESEALKALADSAKTVAACGGSAENMVEVAVKLTEGKSARLIEWTADVLLPKSIMRKVKELFSF